MKYIVLSREQVSNQLQSETFTDPEEAQRRQWNLRQQYHDVLVLTEQEIKEL